jgi:hypothetical protein
MRSVRRETEADGNAKFLPIDLSGVSVFVAMPAHRDLSPMTVMSLLESCRVASEHGIPVRVLIEPGISDVSLARTICVHRFLNQSDATKLFCIDSDMQWSPDSFMRMLALSTKVDVVIGAYPEKSEPIRFHLGTPGCVTMNEYGCITAQSSGLGFTIIDRRVIEAMADGAPRVTLQKSDWKDVPLWDAFNIQRGRAPDGEIIGEDVLFFRHIEDAGFGIWCDPHIQLGHIGTKVYEGSLYDHMMQKVAAE